VVTNQTVGVTSLEHIARSIAVRSVNKAANYLIIAIQFCYGTDSLDVLFSYTKPVAATSIATNLKGFSYYNSK
jgi:hypothetical protein